MSDALIMAGRSLRLSARSPEALLTALMLPVMLMVVFVYLFGGAVNIGTAYVDYVAPGVLLLCAVTWKGPPACAHRSATAKGLHVQIMEVTRRSARAYGDDGNRARRYRESGRRGRCERCDEGVVQGRRLEDRDPSRRHEVQEPGRLCVVRGPRWQVRRRVL